MENNYLLLPSHKFKTNYILIRYVMDANERNASYTSLLAGYISYVNQKNQTYKEALTHLDSLFGVSVNAYSSIKGDKITFDFVVSFVANRYLKQENYLENVIETLFDYLFDPLVKDNTFDEAIFNLKQYELKERIESLYDDKMSYALERFLKIFAKDYPLAIDMNGSVETLMSITHQSLYSFYQDMIKEVPLVAGMVNEKDLSQIKTSLVNRIKETSYSHKFQHYFIKNDGFKEEIFKNDIVQSKLVMGYAYNNKITSKIYYQNMLLNSLLGMSSNSYLFKIVREKENLCYTIRSNYDQYSNSIFIMAGIEKKNYEKTCDLVAMIIDKIKAGDISEDEFKDAKTVIIDQLNKLNDSQAGYINYLVNRQAQGLSMDLEEDIKQIAAIEIKDIVSLAQNLEIKTKFLLSGEKNE